MKAGKRETPLSGAESCGSKGVVRAFQQLPLTFCLAVWYLPAASEAPCSSSSFASSRLMYTCFSAQSSCRRHAGGRRRREAMQACNQGAEHVCRCRVQLSSRMPGNW